MIHPEFCFHARQLIAVLGIATALVGCASAPVVGVRSGFERRTIGEIAIAPISSTAQFGTPPAEWRQLEAEALRRITAELESMGFATLDPEAMRDELERRRAWSRFTDLLNFPDGLDSRFEPSPYAPATAEVLLLRELAAEDLIGSPAILFTEIVYHSTGDCSVDPRDHNRFAIVVDRRGVDVDARDPSPCVVTHIQAKLVDVKTARTMWHNRVLREMRGTDLGRSDGEGNVGATTTSVVAGAHGLAPFAPSPSLDAVTNK